MKNVFKISKFFILIPILFSFSCSNVYPNPDVEGLSHSDVETIRKTYYSQHIKNKVGYETSINHVFVLSYYGKYTNDSLILLFNNDYKNSIITSDSANTFVIDGVDFGDLGMTLNEFVVFYRKNENDGINQNTSYQLEEAYKSGLITKSDLETIAIKYKENS